VIRDAGDSTLVLELESRIDPGVNARAIAIADAVRRRRLRGVRDVVSTYRSVAAFFDPLQTQLEALARALDEAEADAPAAMASQTVDVPVAYGGENGPDLPEVARLTGLTERQVIDKHAGRPYRVFMLGFVPGFAYMGVVDESIRTPRRATPRVRVPAGSVAIAGAQTGIYPQETPGGWQLIGRTRVRPFDPDREPAFLVTAGDHVRFVAVESLDDTGAAPTARVEARDDAGHGGLTVVRPGLLTTIQDLGRWGSQDHGVPVAGPMDSVSHRIANAVVGNPRDAATMEVTLLGPELRFEQDAVFAISGAELRPSLDARPVARNMPVQARKGQLLRFGNRENGVRAYLAIAGGIATRPVLGSRATHVLSAMGGLHGRPLASGDRVPLAEAGATGRLKAAPTKTTMWGPALAVPRTFERHVTLRVLPGPQDEFFDAAAVEQLQAARFTVSPQSNRMAYRLTGGVVPRASEREMISDATVFGGVQVPPSGEPILLMADRQTSGGYPQIATVISADLPLAGQLAPGDTIRFRVCTRREAIAALLAQEGPLVGLG